MGNFGKLPFHEDICSSLMSLSYVYIHHPIIVPSDYDVEDAFSSTHSPDYTLASPDYFPASPGNTSPYSLDNLTKYLLASLAISPFHDDPHMKVMQAYNATVLPLSPMFDPQDFFLPEEILPPQKQARFLSSSSTDFSTPPQIEGLGNGRVIIQRDFNQLETKLQEARTQISGFQREKIRHDDEIILAHVGNFTLEIIIEDIQ
ncbi:hypothetical protein Tco_1207393, partial [Tanacetum coccineum]